MKITDFDAVRGENVCYPKTAPDDEGYQWFAKNHAKFNRKNYTVKSGMSNSRSEMYLHEYMEALEPHLKTNPNYPIAEENHQRNSYSGSDKRSKYNSHDRQSAYFSRAGRRSESGHEVLIGTVTGVNYKGTVFINTPKGKGQILARYAGTRQWQRGDRIEVIFHHEKTYDDGNKVDFYNLAETRP